MRVSVMEMAPLIFFISISLFFPQMVSMMKGREIEAGITNLRLLTFTRVSASSIHVSRPSIGLLELPASFPTSQLRVDSTPQKSNVILLHVQIHLMLWCDMNTLFRMFQWDLLWTGVVQIESKWPAGFYVPSLVYNTCQLISDRAYN